MKRYESLLIFEVVSRTACGDRELQILVTGAIGEVCARDSVCCDDGRVLHARRHMSLECGGIGSRAPDLIGYLKRCHD